MKSNEMQTEKDLKNTFEKLAEESTELQNCLERLEEKLARLEAYLNTEVEKENGNRILFILNLII